MADKKNSRALCPAALEGGKAVREEELTFVPVKNSGSVSFSLSFTGSTLRLHSGGKTYQIDLRMEE